MLRKLKDRLRQHLEEKYLFHPGKRELLGRQLFFFDACRALSFNGISGDYAEFGSHGGNTISFAYAESRRFGWQPHLWAFDSFQGLPPQQDESDEHPAWVAGTMATSLDEFHSHCAARGIPRSAYTTVAGYYDQTLPALGASGEPREIALAYIDCDLYSSTKSVLAFLRPRLKHGMILALDDYHCWSAGQIAGNRLAMGEEFDGDEVWQMVPYLSIGWHGQSFYVEDRRLR